MKIALAQTNSHIANFKQNAQKIIEFAKKSKEQGCDLVVFPELALFGYWPFDLLEQKQLIKEQLKFIREIKKNIPLGIGVLFGATTGKNNSAVFLEKGKKEKFFSKELLPLYDIFFEPRHMEPSRIENNILKFKGKKLAITICEDIWAWEKIFQDFEYPNNPILKLKKLKPDFVINLSASPFSLGKDPKRKNAVKNVSKYLRAPVVYVNQVGANDEIIFDGGSFVTNIEGQPIHQCPFFYEDLGVVDMKHLPKPVKVAKRDTTKDLKSALVLGIRDFLDKNGIKKVHLGLSGGIDSAVVACLACEAIGASRVVGIAMPGPFSAPESFDLAFELSKNLKSEFLNVDINQLYRVATEELEVSFGLKEFGVAHENIQSRLRGIVLMGYSNSKNSMLLATGNKSEYAMGYSTLYGDMCGGLAPIGDLLKQQVYEVAKYYNRDKIIIPEQIITRAPSAELRENQKDEDTLPAYPVLDKLVDKFIVQVKPPSGNLEKSVYSQIMKSEFKRWQSPPILRVSDRAFGIGRQYPITWYKGF